MTVKQYCYLSVSECEISWFKVGGLCFRVYAGNISVTWSEARSLCKRRGGDLAVVDSESKRKVIAIHLHSVSLNYPKFSIKKAYIGLQKLVRRQHFLLQLLAQRRTRCS